VDLALVVDTQVIIGSESGSSAWVASGARSRIRVGEPVIPAIRPSMPANPMWQEPFAGDWILPYDLLRVEATVEHDNFQSADLASRATLCCNRASCHRPHGPRR
jgi:hypothetical protein